MYRREGGKEGSVIELSLCITASYPLQWSPVKQSIVKVKFLLKQTLMVPTGAQWNQCVWLIQTPG